MTRRAAAARVVVAVPYLVVYVLVLFPLTLLTVAILGGIDLLWRFATGSGTRLAGIAIRLWDWVGGNARWSLTGRGQFHWTP